MTKKESNLNKNSHLLSAAKVLEYLTSSEDGLSLTEAKRRLLENGRNLLPIGKDRGILTTFFSQFKSPLIYVLLIAAVSVSFLGETSDGALIFFVLLVNALIGTFEEDKAEKTLKSLRDFSRSSAVVFRDGREIQIDDEEVVVGDVIVLRSGEKVPADARIFWSGALKVDESTLSGESDPILKDVELLKKDVPIPDRKNMVYKGSLVVYGLAKAVVVAIGKDTVIGAISQKLQTIEEEIPLKQKVSELSKSIGLSVLFAALLVILIGLTRGINLSEIFFTAVAISVSLIPEGLPVVITLILAKGVYRMAERNALVKNMQAVEVLGEASILAVDKTGTITKNELMVEKVFVGGKEFDILGSGYEAKGDILLENKIVEPLNHPELIFAGKVACFCADASVEFLKNNEVKVIGDPTEAALLTFGQKTGFKKAELETEEPKVYEIPFSFEHKFHTTLHRTKQGFFTTVVGAPEVILSRVERIWNGGTMKQIEESDKAVIGEKIKKFSKTGLRVLAFAIHLGEDATLDIENLPGLCMGGLFAMKDVLREEVVESVNLARENGVKTVMITGDHLDTAEAIGREAGIWKDGDMVISGAELVALNQQELDNKIEKVSVFARVLPEHKLTIIESYKRLGITVGMTGDGVNDALSLRAAHLGIAMGKGGTEVAREAADIILLDNNFKSILSAIHEGRSIYKTIKKVVLYLVSTSIGEFLVIAGALILGLPLPISPSQILWLNLVTDGLLVVALAFEREEFNSKSRGDHHLLSKKDVWRAVLMGSVMMLGTLLVFRHLPTLSLSVLAIFQWFNVWNVRSDRESAFKKPFSNSYLVFSLLITILLHLFAIYNPFMQNMLHTSPISLAQWSLLILIASSVLWVEEIRKLWVRIKRK